MIQRKPLQPGDRVRIYDAGSYPLPMCGTVLSVNVLVDVKTKDGSNWSGFPEQLRRLKPSPAKQEQERPRYRGLCQAKYNGNPVKFAVIELRKGEVVVDREALARAVLSIAYEIPRQTFAPIALTSLIAKAFGLPEKEETK